MTINDLTDSFKESLSELNEEWLSISSGNQSLLDTDFGTLFVIFIIGCFVAYWLSAFVIGFLGLILSFLMLIEGYVLMILEKLLPTKIMTILNKTFEDTENPRLLIYLALVILYIIIRLMNS